MLNCHHGLIKNSIRKIDLGERGQKISGGQVQRLAFARTFFIKKT